MKKTYVVFAMVAFAACIANAEDTAKAPTNPKTVVEFTQQIDSEFVNGAVAQAAVGLFSTDALYEKTEIKGTSTYDLGNNFSLAVSLKDGLETKLNPNATAWLGTLRFRNRFAPALYAQKKIIPEFNAGLGFEYRLASDLSSAKNPATTYATEHRVGGTVNLFGKISTVDYNVAQSVNYFLDPSGGNATDDGALELYGVYGVGTAFPIADGLTLKVNLSDTLVVDFLSAADSASAANYAQTYNYLSLKAALASAEFTPFVAVLLTNVVNKSGGKVANFIGGSVGADFTKGSYVVTGKYDVGLNAGRESAAGVSAGSDQIESHLSIAFKVKI